MNKRQCRTKQDLLAYLSLPPDAITHRQNKPDQLITWAEFLTLLQRFCEQQAWTVEYDRVEDGSVAIFSNE